MTKYLKFLLNKTEKTSIKIEKIEIGKRNRIFKKPLSFTQIKNDNFKINKII